MNLLRSSFANCQARSRAQAAASKRGVARFASTFALAVVSLLGLQAGRAADYTWTGLGTGSKPTAWSNTGNWGGASYPNQAGDSATLVDISGNTQNVDFKNGQITIAGLDIAWTKTITIDHGNGGLQ